MSQETNKNPIEENVPAEGAAAAAAPQVAAPVVDIRMGDCITVNMAGLRPGMTFADLMRESASLQESGVITVRPAGDAAHHDDAPES